MSGIVPFCPARLKVAVCPLLVTINPILADISMILSPFESGSHHRSCIEVTGRQYHALYLWDGVLEEIQLFLEVEDTLVGSEVAADISIVFAPHPYESVSGSMCTNRKFPWMSGYPLPGIAHL